MSEWLRRAYRGLPDEGCELNGGGVRIGAGAWSQMKCLDRWHRLRDFQLRAIDTAALQSAAALGRYIPIHPMSDETVLLRRLDLAPDRCIAVDCYWEIDADVHFVEVQTPAFREGDDYLGISIRTIGDDVANLNIQVGVREPSISRAIFERALSESLHLIRTRSWM